MIYYSVEHSDSIAINVIAHTVESAQLISDVPDAISCGHGIAVILIESIDQDYLEKLLDGENAVIAYR